LRIPWKKKRKKNRKRKKKKEKKRKEKGRKGAVRSLCFSIVFVGVL